SAAPTGVPGETAVDPTYLGLNITPYDSDNQDFIGDTRNAWSPFGSQQSEPYRWGHAYLEGYQPPADRPTEPREPTIPDTALRGVESPQTIYQSATRGVTIAGLPGTVRAFAWTGDPAMVPVWVSSCPGDELGFSTCSPEDVAAAPWAPDMGGRLLGVVADVEPGSSTVTMELDAAALEPLRTDG